MGVLRITCFATMLVFVDASLNVFMLKFAHPIWMVFKWGLAFAGALATDLLLINRMGIWAGIAGFAVGYSLAIVMQLGYILLHSEPQTGARV